MTIEISIFSSSSVSCVLYQDFAAGINCSSLGYIAGFLPNFITKNIPGYETAVAARLKLRSMYNARFCDRNYDLLMLMCGLTFPKCPVGDASVVAPCRQFCEDVSAVPQCHEEFAMYGALNLTNICPTLPMVPVPGQDGLCSFY